MLFVYFDEEYEQVESEEEWETCWEVLSLYDVWVRSIGELVDCLESDLQVINPEFEGFGPRTTDEECCDILTYYIHDHVPEGYMVYEIPENGAVMLLKLTAYKDK